MIDTVQYMNAENTSPPKTCRLRVWYGPDVADKAAIENLHTLQANRPLKPPGKNNE